MYVGIFTFGGLILGGIIGFCFTIIRIMELEKKDEEKEKEGYGKKHEGSNPIDTELKTLKGK